MAHFRPDAWSLRTRLALLVALTALVPVVIMAVMESRRDQTNLTEDTERVLTARSEQIAHEFDSVHRGYMAAARRVARLPATAGYCRSNAAERTRLARTASDLLKNFNGTDEFIFSASLVSPEGIVLISSEPAFVGADVSAVPSLRAAASGKPTISEVRMSHSRLGEEPIMGYLVPVRDAQGSVVCVVTLAVRAEVLWKVLKEYDGLAGPDSYGIVYDHYGIRIAGTNTRVLVHRPGGALPPEEVEAMVASNRFGAATRQVLSDVQAVPENFARARAPTVDERMYTVWSITRNQAAYVVAHRMHTVDWTVFYSVPVASISKKLEKETREILLIVGISLLASLLTGLIFATDILRSLRAMAAATRSVAAGQPGTQVPVLRTDELGQLAVSFNAMARQIEEQSTALRQSHADLEAFVGTVSHDLRAPLHAVAGFADALQRRLAGQIDAQSQHYLDRVQAGASRMDAMIQALLRLAGVERQPLQHDRVELAQLVEETLTELRASGALTDDRVHVGPLPAVYGDADLLRQVVQNLLSNACKFTRDAAKPRVDIGTEVHGTETVIVVRDNGAGFDMDHASQLFQPFRRLHAQQEFQGVGVGLSIVHSIVRRHGGRIWASARPGEGAAFYLVLPLVA